jgi:salicylate hydroxylase
MGGLTAALALQEFGFRVAVYEAAPELAEVGAGLTLASNASVVLQELGLRPVLDDLAVVPSRGAVLHYRDGRVLVDIPRGPETTHFGAPYCQIHRADLHAALVAAVRANDPDCIHVEHRVVAIEQSDAEVTASFAGGQVASGDVLIGCDGIRSTVREQLFGRDEPRFTGYAAWRGLIPMASLDPDLVVPESAVWIGPGHFLTRYKIRRGELLNYVAMARTESWAEEGWAVRSTVDAVLTEFAEFEPVARTILAATPPDECFRWGIFDRDPLPRWSAGRVTLLGDAAHPMTPFLGQGAAMALEDAMVIARCFAASESVAEALARYEAARIGRCTFTMTESSHNGRQLTTFDPDSYTAEVHRNEESLGLATYNAVRCRI